MQIIKRHITKLFIASFLFFQFSCKKFLELPPPQDMIQTKEIFKNDQTAISSVMGLYSSMLTSPLYPANCGMSIFPGLSADELYNVAPNPEITGFLNNALMPNNGNINSFLWSFIYKTIYHSNSIIESIDNSTLLSIAVKNQLKGEALVVRALHYFYLVNMYGNVPLIITSNYELNQNMIRTDVNQVYQQMVNDLQQAKSLLSVNYATSGKVRPNKWTATSLLARVYLYLKDWRNAELQSSEVINSGTYNLVINLDNVFLSTSAESIWSLRQETINTSEGQTFIPIFSFLAPNYGITTTLLNSFEAGDQRKNKWINSNTVNGQTNYYPYKYKKGYDFSSPAPPITEFYVVFRLAEQYLIRAEARIQQNDVLGAQTDLNTIRNRASLNNTVAIDKSSILAAIEQERKIELFAEWGHRWFDLKRLNRADAVLSVIKAPNWQPTDALYPIPAEQILSNRLLTQNPGY